MAMQNITAGVPEQELKHLHDTSMLYSSSDGWIEGCNGGGYRSALKKPSFAAGLED